MYAAHTQHKNEATSNDRRTETEMKVKKRKDSTGEDQTLLVRGDALLVLDLLLHVLNRVRRVDVQRDGLAGQCLDEDLHGAPAQAQHQVERGLLLDVVVR
jgi:hypothetical protein